MARRHDKRVTVIAGPTASGKSALAIDLALSLGTDVIGADSRQIYRGMPVITAVPRMNERRGVRHRLVEVLELEQYCSAAHWCEMALEQIREVFAGHDEAIVCGGSMLYIDALCRGLDDLPSVPDDIRRAVAQEAEEKGAEWARMELLRLDPDYYRAVDLNNIRRVVHAIELIRTSGRTYSSMRKGKRAERPFDIEVKYINPPREELFARINTRVEEMVSDGALDEARRLYPLRHLNSLNTVGLKELFAYLDGSMSLDEAIARIQKNTRVYAKKQMLWVRHRMNGE